MQGGSTKELGFQKGFKIIGLCLPHGQWETVARIRSGRRRRRKVGTKDQ